MIFLKHYLDLIDGPNGDEFDRSSSGLFRILLKQLGQPDSSESDVLEISLEAAGGVLVGILMLVVAYWFLKQLISGTKLCCPSRPRQHPKVKFEWLYIYIKKKIIEIKFIFF